MSFNEDSMKTTSLSCVRLLADVEKRRYAAAEVRKTLRQEFSKQFDWNVSILQHLGLLFIPASVGVVLYLPLLQANAWAISAALVVSVVATVAVTAGLLKVLAKKEPTDE